MALFDLENPLPQHSLFAIETDHSPAFNSDHLLRREIISFISHYSENLNHPFISYLATDYLHRFIASHSIPGGKPWILKLVAVACVSLAFKMMEPDSSLSDFPKEFDSQMVERMEFLILGALKWRMRSITPFAFIKFVVSLFKFKDSSLRDDDDLRHHQVLKDRATEIIFKAQIESKFFEFKPSIIAASALLCASHELYPLQFSTFKTSISTCSYVNQDEFVKCYSVIEELVMDGYESMLSCKTPINVLDLDYSSSEDTDHKNTTDEEEEEKRGLKRVKMSTF